MIASHFNFKIIDLNQALATKFQTLNKLLASRKQAIASLKILAMVQIIVECAITMWVMSLRSQRVTLLDKGNIRFADRIRGWWKLTDAQQKYNYLEYCPSAALVEGRFTASLARSLGTILIDVRVARPYVPIEKYMLSFRLQLRKTCQLALAIAGE